MYSANVRRAPSVRPTGLLLAIAAAAGGPRWAGAVDPGPIELSPAALTADSPVPQAQDAAGFTIVQAEPPEATVAPRPGHEARETVVVEEPTIPIALGLTYALYTDYIFRGINFSEPAGEGREKPNHQLTVSLAYNTGSFGTIGFDTWFEWYGGQKLIDPERGGQNLQEVDYLIWWRKTIDPIATDLTLGYTFYEFVNLAHTLRQDGRRGNNNDDRTHEYCVTLKHNDAWTWKWLFPDNKGGILNPSYFFAHDVGALTGVWMEWALSHDFAIPGIDNLTITPRWKMAAQGDYWKHGFFLTGDTWTLALSYDLTPLLHLPSWAGKLLIGGDLNFFNAWGNFEGPDYNGSIRGQDEFWGGMTVSWLWGG